MDEENKQVHKFIIGMDGYEIPIKVKCTIEELYAKFTENKTITGLDEEGNNMALRLDRAVFIKEIKQ